jgi:N-methylhydantoinase A
MKYTEQVYDLDVPVDFEVRDADDVARLARAFTTRYAERYGENAGFGEGGIQITAFHVRGTGITTKAPLSRTADTAGEALDVLSRPVYWAELSGFADTPVLRTTGRWGGERRDFEGPLLVELPDTVIVVRPGQRGSLLPNGSAVVETSVAG